MSGEDPPSLLGGCAVLGAACPLAFLPVSLRRERVPPALWGSALPFAGRGWGAGCWLSRPGLRPGETPSQRFPSPGEEETRKEERRRGERARGAAAAGGAVGAAGCCSGCCSGFCPARTCFAFIFSATYLVVPNAVVGKGK